MQKDWHTRNTKSDDFVRYLSRRPKCAMRRIADPYLRAAAGSYILNRGTQAEAYALKVVEELCSSS